MPHASARADSVFASATNPATRSRTPRSFPMERAGSTCYSARNARRHSAGSVQPQPVRQRLAERAARVRKRRRDHLVQRPRRVRIDASVPQPLPCGIDDVLVQIAQRVAGQGADLNDRREELGGIALDSRSALRASGPRRTPATTLVNGP